MKAFRFGHGIADGDATQRELLGGKGANLAEMCRVGLPVPPGFTLPTNLCHEVIDHGALPPAAKQALDAGVAFVEEASGKRIGDPKQPLLFSVRSGARASMPGMMDTVLNLGLNDAIVESWAAHEGDPRFVRDAYRRFLHMYADVVLGLCTADDDPFERALSALKKERGVLSDLDLSDDDLAGLAKRYRELVVELTGDDQAIPDEPRVQLQKAVEAVFLSWNTARAQAYRQIHHIPSSWGTAANVQVMVFGDRSERSATGVCFTRNPASGAPGVVGEALESAQGEDVVAGIRTPLALEGGDAEGDSFSALFPEAYDQLKAGCHQLEAHFRDMQDIEFTVEKGKLWFLQTRTGKRTARAAVRIAVDLVREGVIHQDEALLRVDAHALEALWRPVASAPAVEEALARGDLFTTGLGASPGTGTGRLVLDPAEAVAAHERGEKVVLVRSETSADDVAGMVAAEGILTAHGGQTSHAAVVARGMGKPAVVGAGELDVDLAAGTVRCGKRTLLAGDVLTLDGTSGRAFVGTIETEPPRSDPELDELMGWADKRRRLGVRANADTPEAAVQAAELGAEGVGLCRTEHMFFAPDRLLAMRGMILAEDDEQRAEALAKLRPMQQADFEGLFEAMGSRPVAVRLLDPPLHEFLPRTDEAMAEVARDLDVDVEKVREAVDRHHESNPMLGHRGCRLAITYPAIARMQAGAVLEAAAAVFARGITPDVEIMVPLVADPAELEEVLRAVEAEAEELRTHSRAVPSFRVGAMLELPRACLLAGELAKQAEFFSFGTNDLTQTTFGLSRDDAGRFLPLYVDQGLLARNPFVTLDARGVGELVELAVHRARAARPDVELGLCGEHGGDPDSVGFCHRVGLDYVSCSPFRVPGARLAAAQAAARADSDS